MQVVPPKSRGPWPPRTFITASETLELAQPLPLDSGQALPGVRIAYEAYGELSPAQDNAILVCHATSGDQYVASPHPITGKPGWWDRMVGPGKPIDTGPVPCDLRQCHRRLHGLDRPGQPRPRRQALGDALPGHHHPRHGPRASGAARGSSGSGDLYAVVGGSMGGMQALSLAANWPHIASRVLAIGATATMPAQNIAFQEVGRQAIMADPDWQGGDYYGTGKAPDAGLSVARMAAHITYLSEASLTEKFGRRLQDRPDGQPGAKTFGFDADFQVESYLRHQGTAFTGRFDANSYLYLTRAMSYFDLTEDHGGRLAEVFAGNTARFCVVSFDSDWLYPTELSRRIAHALNAAGAPVSFVELSAPFGHDSFLLDVPELDRVVTGFLRQ